VTVLLVVLAACVLAVLAFAAGAQMSAAKSSSKYQAAQSILKAAEAVSAVSARESSRSSQDWELALKIQQVSAGIGQLEKNLQELVCQTDRMDITLAKVAEWTVIQPGRRKIQTRDPVDLFVARTHSELPRVPTYLDPEEAQVARPAAPSERGPL
jgi:hypothetical protein